MVPLRAPSRWRPWAPRALRAPTVPTDGGALKAVPLHAPKK